MSLFKLIIRSLWYYRKNHFAVLLGTMISTAVLTGALIIGDSVKYSLSSLVDKRLGNVVFSMETGDRFVTNTLTDKLSEALKTKTTSILKLNAVSINPSSSERVNTSQVLGVDKDFWSLSNVDVYEINEEEAIISDNLSHQLGLSIGDELLLRIEKKGFVPSNAPFVQEETSVAIRLKIIGVADKNHFGRFSLRSNQVAPYNIFVSKDFLAKKMNLSGYSNMILVENNRDKNLSVDMLNTQLKNSWTIKDAGLILEKLEKSNVIELRSKRIFLEPGVANPLLERISEKQEILSYLVNTIRSKNVETPYSFVSALSSLDEQLKPGEVIINDWLAADLQVRVNDSIRLDYYVIGPMRKLIEESRSFMVKGIIPIGQNGIDQTLMPPFPGLTSANSCKDWGTGVPIDLNRIRNKDEEYWNVHKGTPKVILGYQTAEALWSNRFGNHTALRFPADRVNVATIEQTVLSNVNPQALGLSFIAVRDIGNLAVENSIGFGELFLSLSFFVIIAGILLTTLLYALNMEKRKQESGILAACGFSKKKIRRIQTSESALIAILGGLMGAVLGILYNKALMAAVNSIWIDIVRTSELDIYLCVKTLILGALSGIVIALIVIYIISVKKLKEPIVTLIKKTFSTRMEKRKQSQWYWVISLLSLSGVVYIFLGTSANEASGFMIASALFLLACFVLVKIYLNYLQQKTNTNTLKISSLLFRNASANQSRSMAVIILLALGTFTILITGANHKTFYGLEQDNSSGTGGYLYWVENSLPILNDLNDVSTFEIGENQEISFVQFHRLEGDDASCLNLNQVNQPQILGVNPKIFDRKKAFSFAKLHESINENNPWLALEKETDKDIIPAYADQTVITWGLKRKIGDTLYYQSENGKRIGLVLMGGLKSSVFQGNLLITDANFTKYFPSVSGSKVMLVDAPPSESDMVREILYNDFVDYGIAIQAATMRLAEFNSVTNTYLSVFMTLGGLGVLIGTIGLGVVLLRNMQDRKQEIALMQAIGFAKNKILKIVFLENVILLIAGMLIGLLSASIGIIPSLLSRSFEVQAGLMFIILILIFLNGVAWIYFTARSMMKFFVVKMLQTD